jgi:hypothetical protein
MSLRERTVTAAKLVTAEEFDDQHNYDIGQAEILVQVLLSYETDKAIHVRAAYCCVYFGSSTLWIVRVGSNELFSKKRPSVSQY